MPLIDSNIIRGLLSGLLCLAVTGRAAADGGFKIESAAPLSVTYNGTAVIVRDTVKPEFTATPAVSTVRVPGWDMVYHVWRGSKTSQARMEAAAAGGEFEFTFCRLIQADVAGFVNYTFVVPHEFLDGRQVEVLGTVSQGEAQGWKGRALSGVMGGDGIQRLRPVKYLRVHHPAGDLDFDFNPRGPWVCGQGITKRAAEWNMRRTGDGYVFSTAFSRTIWGTLQEFKFIIRRADERAVDGVHPPTAVRWSRPYANLLMLNIGDSEARGYVNVPLADVSPDSAAHWLKADGLRVERDDRFRAVGITRYEGVAPKDPALRCVLRIRLPRDGYHMVNMCVGARDRPIGPCKIFVGDKLKTTASSVPAESYDSWSVVAHSRAGGIDLGLAGDFRLTAVGIAPMMYDNEDFLFRRNWWLSSERHPGDTLPDY